MTKFGSWNITDTGFQGSWNFYTFLTSIHRELNIEPLFKIQVRPDFKNSSIHRIMVRVDCPTNMLESFEWETYGTELRSRYGIEDIYSTNHSAQNHCSTNQNAWTRRSHGTNRTVTTSHSHENDQHVIYAGSCVLIQLTSIGISDVVNCNFHWLPCIVHTTSGFARKCSEM